MNITVIDDLEPDRINLRSLLEKYFAYADISANISEFSTKEQFSESFRSGKYQLIFLSIYTDNISGVEIARHIRLKDTSCDIVFLSESNNFAVESYEVAASGYILKPVTVETLFPIMNRLTSNNIHNDSLTLSVRSKGKNSINLNVNYSDIIYIDVLKKVVRIHTTDKIIEVSNTFSECAENLLKNNRFSNCCRANIVNFDYVDEIVKNDFQMLNGELVPIRNHGGKEIKKDYIRYKLKAI